MGGQVAVELAKLRRRRERGRVPSIAKEECSPGLDRVRPPSSGGYHGREGRVVVVGASIVDLTAKTLHREILVKTLVTIMADPPPPFLQ